MKSKIIICAALLTLTACLWWIASANKGSASKSSDESKNLSLKVKASKDSFILGEAVQLEIITSNSGETPVSVYKGRVEVGNLKVFIADRDNEYKEYLTSGWGRLQGSKETIEPNQFLKSPITILWNAKPNIEGWSELYAKPVRDTRIMTDYAFPEQGVYSVKVIYYGDDSTKIESEPIQIVVNDPVGDDLKVWNQIKGNLEIALLMQTGEFNTSKEAAKTRLIKEVEQTLEKYPNSTYSGYLKPNLEKFKESEERRKELRQQNRNNQEKQP